MTDSNLAKQFAKQIIRTAAKENPIVKPKAASETNKKITALKKLETRDKNLIIMLQNRIKELEGKMNRKNRERVEEEEIHEERIETLDTELDTLRERIKGKGIDIETQSEKRVEAVEKISKAKDDYIEIMKLEDKLKKMEDSYEKLKSWKKYPLERLEVIKLAIEDLKDKITVKKFDLEKQKEIPDQRPVIRHTMKFGMFAPKKSVPSEDKINLPIPGEAGMPDLTIPKPRKRGIFRRLFFGK